jgi:hypothetical protein
VIKHLRNTLLFSRQNYSRTPLCLPEAVCSYPLYQTGRSMSLNSEYAGLQTNCHHACTQRQESRTTTGIHTTTRKATPTELTFDSRNEALLPNQLQLLGLLQSSQIPARVDSAPQPVKPSYLFSLLKCNLNEGKALSAIGEFKASDNKLCLPDSSAADSLPATVFPVAEIFRREIHAAVTGTLVAVKPTDFWKSVSKGMREAGEHVLVLKSEKEPQSPCEKAPLPDPDVDLCPRQFVCMKRLQREEVAFYIFPRR